MAVATIQFNAETAGRSVLGLPANSAVTLTDAGGPGATSYLWEYLQVPATYAAFPSITNSTSQIATAAVPVGNFTDGIYLVRLTRDDAIDGVTTDVKFFGVADIDGLYLPTAGMNRNNSNVGGSAAAQAAGWFGSTIGSTNVFLDAILRLRRDREGRYIGRFEAVAAGGTPTTDQIDPFSSTDGHPYKFIFLDSASDDYTVELINPPPQDVGSLVIHFLVGLEAGGGDFVLNNGYGGAAILTLTPPPLGAVYYSVSATYDSDANDWVPNHLELLGSNADTLHVYKDRLYTGLAGVAENDTDTFQRVGSILIDSDTQPPDTHYTFEAVIETSVNNAEVRLYNVTAGGVVASSTLTTANATPTYQSAVVTLPIASGVQLYEVQLRMSAAGGPGDVAVCSMARVKAQWA